MTFLLIALTAAIIMLGVICMMLARKVDELDEHINFLWIGVAELAMERKEKGEGE